MREEGRGEGGGKREDPARIGSLHQAQLDGRRDSAGSAREGKRTPLVILSRFEGPRGKRDWCVNSDHLFVRNPILFMFPVIPGCVRYLSQRHNWLLFE